MSTTIIAMYDNPDTAQQVLHELLRAGVSTDEIEVLGGDDASRASLTATLAEREVDQEEAEVYAEMIGKGAAMVLLDSPNEKVEDVSRIMRQFGVRDLDQVLEGAAGSSQERASLSKVEEQVSIGKRRVVRGGLRLTSTVSERPVEETVLLREETVALDRQRTDRKLSPEEAEKAFQQKTIEVTETAEEAVISKEARVVEEVTLEKAVAEREETVRATARRTDVKVEEIDPRQAQPRRS